MTDRPPSQGALADAGRYEIRLAGHLDMRWAAWFDGLTVATDRDGTTVLVGDLPDQAALHGALQRARDLGLPLLSVRRLDPEPPLPPPTDR
jgi:hypothetical protein